MSKSFKCPDGTITDSLDGWANAWRDLAERLCAVLSQDSGKKFDWSGVDPFIRVRIEGQDDALTVPLPVAQAVVGYAAMASAAEECLAAVRRMLERNGCDCPCDCREHCDRCKRCLGCRIQEVLR